ncbi:DNA primase [Bradyrhizobium yuanmingense]|uniref:DNA primase family protein n=1 Tax=Bradyrhizobium yuanmingense TaxID=108015 RepID=UPI000FE38F64|nr:DNA primase family protein [Bradyrhizobium yuanmingense]TGN76202.1 DNA primase [Bradyrhizobium yuanmingense]
MSTSTKQMGDHQLDEVSRQIADWITSDATHDFGHEPPFPTEGDFYLSNDWTAEAYFRDAPIEDPPEWLMSVPPNVGDGSTNISADASAPAGPPVPPIWKVPDQETLAACSMLDQSDTDNAKRLEAYFPDELLIMQAAGIAGGDKLAWSGRHWDIDNGEAYAWMMAQAVGDFIQLEADFLRPSDAEQKAIDEAAKAASELSRTPDPDETSAKALREAVKSGKVARRSFAARKVAHKRFGVISKNASRLKAMLECGAPRWRKPAEEFNASALSLATLSHTLTFVQESDLECPDEHSSRMVCRIIARKGHRKSDYITALVPVSYDASARAPFFESWIEKMMPDPEARRTLQQYSGISILGVPLQRFMFHYGEGANGKSVYLEMLMRLLGKSFAVGLPTESIIGQGERSAGGASPDLIRLFGKRMVRVLELPEGKPLQSELIKKLTGSEEIPVRTLFKGFIDFMPRAKPHMSGNGLPKISDTSNGIWRRMLLLKWPVQIAEKDMRDPEELVGEMLKDASGILNWLCEGAVDFLQNGLYVAPSVAAATAEYRREMDIVMQFAEDCLERVDGSKVQARAMYEAFMEWCRANSKSPVFETKFGRDMKRHFERDDSKRLRFYINVKLRDDRPRAEVKTSYPLDDVVPV